MTTAAASESLVGGPLAEPLDEALMATAWRQLANESMMYLLDMDTVAMKIDSHRQLFVDNTLIAEAQNVTRQVHQPRRYEGNPILATDGEENVMVMKVLQFEEPPLFRMWYWSCAHWHPWAEGQEIRCGTSYAISDDGVHWERPHLDLHKIEPIKQRNIILPYGPTHGVFYEPWEEDPQKRFKAMTVVCIRRNEQKGPEGLVIPEAYHLHTSPDGIHFKCEGNMRKHVLPFLAGRDIPQNGVGDTSRFWWDPLRRKYIGDIKFVIRGEIGRCRAMTESDDLIHWTRPHPTFASREEGHEVYGHTGLAYEGMYIGFRWIFEPEIYDSDHCMGVELDCSRDGKRWTRVGAGQPFMTIDPTQRENWDCDSAKITSLLIMGDELWIYYASQQGYMSVARGQSGLAKLRLDGFASINSNEQEGQLLTRPLGFEGTGLHVNAQVETDGELRVGFVTHDRQPIDGLGLDDCEPITTDGIHTPVRWKGGGDIRALSGTDARMAFRLRKAKLYSFKIV